jgi:DNA-binding transcriptional LysR family regulator
MIEVMELRYFQYFVAVAEELHFNRAASKVGITQPALSQQIRSLEAELGFPLLRRTKQKVELLPAGNVFLKEAKRILYNVERAVQNARRVHEGKIGQLRIGFIGSAMYETLPTLLKAYRHTFPDVDVELRELPSSEQAQQLSEGYLDIGFVRSTSPFQDDSFALETIAEEPLVLALATTHPLAQQNDVTLKELQDTPLIIFPRQLGSDFYDAILRLFDREGLKPQVVQEVVEMHVIVSLVANGLGMALVPASVAALRPRDVVYKSVTEQAIRVPLAAAWQKHNRSPTLQAFLKVMKEAKTLQES